MKRFVMAAALLCASCALQRAEDIRLIAPTAFERTVNGVSTSLYTLRGGDLTMQVTDYGARITGLWAPDREGRMDDIVIGHPRQLYRPGGYGLRTLRLPAQH